MTLKTVSLSALCAPKDNPRRILDQARIEGLAESIKTDGVLQNLVVEPNGDGKFRVITGKRRFLALKLLKRKGLIDADFKVPIEVRRNLTGDDAMRIATVENVQREPLSPMDEADAFAALLQNGAEIDDVAGKTGLSSQTVRRRLALANLCEEAKEAIRTDKLPLGLAEAMTLGTIEQQRSILEEFNNGADIDRETIRHMLLGERPSAAMAIFPLEQYTGTMTSDLFGEEESTFFDDVEQFFTLQKKAVGDLAEKHRKKATFVDVLNVYAAPWWQYQEAEKVEASGVVINLSPSGRVEVKKGVIKHEVKPTVAEETKETPEVPKERPSVSAGLVRYVALEKSIAVMAALLGNPRKAKEVVALQLLIAFQAAGGVRINLHPCVQAYSTSGRKPKAFTIVQTEVRKLFKRMGLAGNGADGLPGWERDNGETPDELYKSVMKLSDEDLDRLIVLLILLSFGQDVVDVLDTEESVFNRVALDLGLSMREWWTPDATFLSLLKRDQLETVAIESGATMRIGKLKDYAKKDLVEVLARYFERTADPSAAPDEHDQKGRTWMAGVMAFPAREMSTTTKH